MIKKMKKHCCLPMAALIFTCSVQAQEVAVPEVSAAATDQPALPVEPLADDAQPAAGAEQNVAQAADVPSVPVGEQREAEKLIEEARKRAQDAASAAMQETPIPENAIRITHVPESIKEEIRAQVRAELRSDVVQDVLVQAKTEQWGMPQALPSWVNKISWKGDVRMRVQADMFADGNAAFVPGPDPDQIVSAGYWDYLAINSNGGYGFTDIEDAFLNTTEDRQRMRIRARLAMDAKANTELKAKLRLSTGSQKDPVSTNQTLGQYSNQYQVFLDRAYLKYDPVNIESYPWLTVYGGRMDNPWLSTDLVWDGDLAFEGVAATYRRNLRGGDNLLDMSEHDRTLFLTVGAFPLQEVELDTRDKWLYGAQIGTEMVFDDQSQFNLGLAYYHFRNISGVRNPVLEGTDTDFTAPSYMQKGNTLFDIRNDNDTDTDLWALAAEYKELNLTLSYDFAQWAPLHVVATADVVKNLGYDKDNILKRTQGAQVERSGGTKSGEDPLKERTLGYHMMISVGWPVVAERRTWRVYGGYKHLERDAVVDAFTDSDFHLGGTDAEGWYLGGEYALIDNTVLSLRWLSSDAIDAAPFGVDTLQVDLTAKF
jgi:hypothetical protein